MRCPRKLYLVVSRKADRGDWGLEDAFKSKKQALAEAEQLNRAAWLGADDWRVETFVKGD